MELGKQLFCELDVGYGVCKTMASSYFCYYRIEFPVLVLSQHLTTFSPTTTKTVIQLYQPKFNSSKQPGQTAFHLEIVCAIRRDTEGIFWRTLELIPHFALKRLQNPLKWRIQQWKTLLDPQSPSSTFVRKWVCLILMHRRTCYLKNSAN